MPEQAKFGYILFIVLLTVIYSSWERKIHQTKSNPFKIMLICSLDLRKSDVLVLDAVKFGYFIILNVWFLKKN